jgi:chorismate synthase
MRVAIPREVLAQRGGLDKAENKRGRACEFMQIAYRAGMSSTFGTLFRVTTFGESHCKGVGVIVDGCPPRMPLTEADIQPQLDRRRPGQSAVSTPRQESDTVTILSGTENGLTLGTPIALLVPNKDQRPGDYAEMSNIPRPSHADYTYQIKYGIRASSGGGRSSARETIGRVAAGAIAEKWLKLNHGIEIVAWVSSVGTIDAPELDIKTISRSSVDATIMRCPDPASAERMIDAVKAARDAGDSLGGIVTCVCRNVPAGLGEPVFDKLEAKLAHAMLSLPATKGFEIGSGFAGVRMPGSAHNDPFIQKGDRLGTVTNYSGGVQGGISNGEPIIFRVAFKPPATIGKAQRTATFDGEETVLEAKGRHDPCVVNRAVPIVEAMAALVLIDAALIQRSRWRSDS